MTLLSATEAKFTDTTGQTARFHVDPNTRSSGALQMRSGSEQRCESRR